MHATEKVLRVLYGNAVKPALFKMDPEVAHHHVISVLKRAEKSWAIRAIMGKIFEFEHPALAVNLWGIDFKNPAGLAAGFDKNAQVVLAMSALGFGHTEHGSATHFSQSGNLKPRLFRLVEDRAVINRMGINNHGAWRVGTNLEGSLGQRTAPVGVNIAVSTEAKDPIEDILATFLLLYPLADYVTVNASCPNVEGHLLQQEKTFLNYLLQELIIARAFLMKKEGYHPILVKVSPDLTWQALDDVLEVAERWGIDGVIATNTTLRRDGLVSPLKNEIGGLSGAPLRQRSAEVIAYIYRRLPHLPIIGVGGIFTARDAWEKIRAGASLVQVFTGMIYEGPFIAKDINMGLVELLEQEGLSTITEMVGAGIG